MIAFIVNHGVKALQNAVRIDRVIEELQLVAKLAPDVVEPVVGKTEIVSGDGVVKEMSRPPVRDADHFVQNEIGELCVFRVARELISDGKL